MVIAGLNVRVGSLTPNNSSLKLSHFLASSSARSAYSASSAVPPPSSLGLGVNGGTAATGYYGHSGGSGAPLGGAENPSAGGLQTTRQAAAAAAAADSWDKAKLEDQQLKGLQPSGTDSGERT